MDSISIPVLPEQLGEPPEGGSWGWSEGTSCDIGPGRLCQLETALERGSRRAVGRMCSTATGFQSRGGRADPGWGNVPHKEDLGFAVS